MGNTELVRTPLYVGIGVIAVAVLFGLLVDGSDESQVEFDAMNGTFEVSCEHRTGGAYPDHFDDVNPLTFSDGAWELRRPYETILDTRHVTIRQVVIKNVVEDSPGPEVVVELTCGLGNFHLGTEVHVFAGNSRQAKRLGEPLPGLIEHVAEHLRFSSGAVSEGFISTTVWSTLDGDARCCPSKYVIVKRHWSDGNWVEGGREVWERTVYERS